MRVLVMGAGVIGVATAYALGRDGHQVVVLDRQPEPACETSHANAGLVAPGHAYAWAKPGAPLMLLRSLWRDDQALRLKFSADPRMWAWFAKFLGQCTSARAAANTRRKLALCQHSLAALRAVRSETGIAYDATTGGALYLHRSQASFERAAANSEILRDGGQRLEIVDPAGAAAIDPALGRVKHLFAGAIHSPEDESGDARLFTHRLAAYCRRHFGTEFRFDCTIRGLEVEAGRVAAVVIGTDTGTDTKNARADAYVLALGCDSPIIARGIGLKLAIYPVKGYSVTFPVTDDTSAPTLPGVDEDNLVAYAHLGDRLRITATAEFTGYDRGHRPGDFRHMLAVARELFPDAGDFDRPDYWAGLRPMTPEGTPYLGRAHLANLYLNTGHGHIGWTLACGSARITAELIAGREPGVDLAGLTLDRG